MMADLHAWKAKWLCRGMVNNKTERDDQVSDRLEWRIEGKVVGIFFRRLWPD